MNLIKELQKDFSKAECDKIVKYIGNDPSRFKMLVEAFLSETYRITQHASWPLSYCVKEHPKLIKPHLKKIIYNLTAAGIHDAVKRNMVRFLQFIEIPKSLHGITLDICLDSYKIKRSQLPLRCLA